MDKLIGLQNEEDAWLKIGEDGDVKRRRKVNR